MTLVILPSHTAREHHGRADRHGYGSGSVKKASDQTTDQTPEAMRCRDQANPVIGYQQRCAGERDYGREVRRQMRGDAARAHVEGVLTDDSSARNSQRQWSHTGAENWRGVKVQVV